ncbi:NAD(P)-dependent oxidoreductase [Listeria ivanovii]|uniref:NAD(P)-dependent oxidoreductase n=1 Tax=Listeria ivanovii TaxID=1638 RepID=UPI000DAA011E|nr:NAD(P)-dependent oxidoreductase [Listeria ivanovii]PZG54906.1 NAD(P)-dependent oxidoreductase [Listeria ivanovii]
MKIGIIGATGRAGSRILEEAKSHGHEVTAIVRNAGKITQTHKDINILQKDIFDLTLSDVSDLNVVIDAYGTSPEEADKHVASLKHLMKILNGTVSPRLIVVGGAASLEVDENGNTLLESKGLKDAPYYPTAKAQAEQLTHLKENESHFSWTYISPPAMFEPGERTGSYQSGKNHLLFDSEGNSFISMEDFAIAILDEFERPNHLNERFTVAGK